MYPYGCTGAREPEGKGEEESGSVLANGMVNYFSKICTSPLHYMYQSSGNRYRLAYTMHCTGV